MPPLALFATSWCRDHALQYGVTGNTCHVVCNTQQVIHSTRMRRHDVITKSPDARAFGNDADSARLLATQLISGARQRDSVRERRVRLGTI